MITDEQRDYMLENGFTIHEIRILIWLELHPKSSLPKLALGVLRFYHPAMWTLVKYNDVIVDNELFSLSQSIPEIVKKRILIEYDEVFNESNSGNK